MSYKSFDFFGRNYILTKRNFMHWYMRFDLFHNYWQFMTLLIMNDSRFFSAILLYILLIKISYKNFSLLTPILLSLSINKKKLLHSYLLLEFYEKSCWSSKQTLETCEKILSNNYQNVMIFKQSFISLRIIYFSKCWQKCRVIQSNFDFSYFLSMKPKIDKKKFFGFKWLSIFKFVPKAKVLIDC
jgi:hypothetical protein